MRKYIKTTLYSYAYVSTYRLVILKVQGDIVNKLINFQYLFPKSSPYFAIKSINNTVSSFQQTIITTSNTIKQEYARHDYGIIDYGTCQGRKIYNRATSELNEIKYRCNLKDLSTLINDLSNGASALGWTKRFGFQVPYDDNDLQGDYYNFLNEYESIEFDKLRRFASRITKV